MEELLTRLEGLFRHQFAHSTSQLEIYTPERISGFLIWNQFAALEQIERQRLVWNMLQQHLSPAEQTRISAILTLTPEEWNATQEQPQAV